jgi:hypothetical protein
MSQFKFNTGTNVLTGQYPANQLAEITLGSANSGQYTIGETVYQGASLAAATATAKVSGYASTTKLRVKGVRGTWANTTAVVGAKSTASNAAAGSSAFAWGWTASRDSASGFQNVTRQPVAATDQGFIVTQGSGYEEITVAASLGLSKIQNTDTSVGPTLTYSGPAAATYKAGQYLTFRVKSNEALAVTGTPQITVTFNAGGAGTNTTGIATYNVNRSSPQELVFSYIVQTADKDGVCTGVSYSLNGGTVTDVGGAAVTLSATWNSYTAGNITIAD